MLKIGLLRQCGIEWDGSEYEGKPLGNFTEEQIATIRTVQQLPGDKEGLAGADLAAIKGLVKPAQRTAIDAYQQSLKDEHEDEIILALAKSFLRLAYQIGESGEALTAANLKPWRDKVKAAFGKGA